MAIDQSVLHRMESQETEMPELDLSWLDSGAEWGIRAVPRKRGLTLDEINIGSYARTERESHNDNARPRGAAARVGVPRTG